jgi:pimeloyl-ACP methyl ester carboxylesterase
MRGLGDSSRPAAGYDNGTVAGDVIELLDSHGVHEFSLVGHDWGGPVAFAATLLARDRVKKLALVDTVLAGDGRSAGSGQGGARWHHLFHRTSRAVDRVGHILCRPTLDGLHHQYGRI